MVSDGSAVLGLGDIGPAAAMPVMEGKAMLLKSFADVDAYPICLDERDPDKLVDIIAALSVGFGGINLEDIAAPRCFEVEGKLRRRLDIPVFHDDQHGTAVVVLAALYNAARLVGKRVDHSLRVVVQGIGAAGIAVSNLLMAAGVSDLVGVDRGGIVTPRRREARDPIFRRLGKQTNPRGLEGPLETALDGADVFIGLSAGDTVDVDHLRLMGPDRIVFAMANPVPEIDPVLARQHAAVVATGRSDEPNQINNVLCFPGLFRGAARRPRDPRRRAHRAHRRPRDRRHRGRRAAPRRHHPLPLRPPRRPRGRAGRRRGRRAMTDPDPRRGRLVEELRRRRPLDDREAAALRETLRWLAELSRPLRRGRPPGPRHGLRRRGRRARHAAAPPQASRHLDAARRPRRR